MKAEAKPQKVNDPMLRYIAPENRQEGQALIDELDLIPVSVTKIEL